MKADKSSVTRKLKIVKGQIDGLLKMVEDDRYCIDISNQLLASQSLLRSINREIIEAHLRSCVREALDSDDKNSKLEEIISLLIILLVEVISTTIDIINVICAQCALDILCIFRLNLTFRIRQLIQFVCLLEIRQNAT